MTNATAWLPALLTIFILLIYESALLLVQHHTPARLARTAHATLREEWFGAISKQRGSEILAVQTLRNSLMSTTMTGSTAVLVLIGTVTLSAPSVHSSFGTADADVITLNSTARLSLELVLMAIRTSLVCSVIAVR